MRLAFLFVIALPGCVASSENDEGPQPPAASADVVGGIYQGSLNHGALRVGVNHGELTETTRFNEWRFEVPAEGRSVQLYTVEAPGEPEHDTLLFLYRRVDGAWSLIEQNDEETPGALLSRLDVTLEAGTYRVVVGGQEASAVRTLGSFRLHYHEPNPTCEAAARRAAEEFFASTSASRQRIQRVSLLLSENNRQVIELRTSATWIYNVSLEDHGTVCYPHGIVGPYSARNLNVDSYPEELRGATNSCRNTARATIQGHFRSSGWDEPTIRDGSIELVIQNPDHEVFRVRADRPNVGTETYLVSTQKGERDRDCFAYGYQLVGDGVTLDP